MAKLVEILARELKAWPDCKHGEKIETKALTQDDDGRINALDSGCSAEQDQFNGGVWSGAQWTWTDLNFERAEDYTTAIVTRAEWQAAVDALKPDAQRFAEDYVEANKGRNAKEWDGVGLPPVGVSCERRFPDVRGSSWNGCIILAHGARRIFVRDNCGDEWAHNIDEVEFRPFRTPDRIAAYELRAIIESGLDGRKTLDQVIEEIIGAGYRKQGQK